MVKYKNQHYIKFIFIFKSKFTTNFVNPRLKKMESQA